MAKFDVNQAMAVAAIKQVIYEWGDELDLNDGLNMKNANVLTGDCRYFVGGEWREGLEATAQFYQERMARLKEANAVPVMRHIITNLKITFTDEGHAKVEFLLVFFAKSGEPPFTDYCDPLAVADVHMECRKEGDEHWRISKFDSGQIFQRG